jgi:hypothetical protein
MSNIPWLLIAVVAYNILAFALGAPAGAPGVFEQEVTSVPLMSGAVWPVRLGDLVIVFALAMLLADLVFAPPPGGHSIVDHGLSVIVFIVCVLEFLTVPRAGTPVFFTITVIALADVAAGAAMALKTKAQK